MRLSSSSRRREQALRDLHHNNNDNNNSNDNDRRKAAATKSASWSSSLSMSSLMMPSLRLFKLLSDYLSSLTSRRLSAARILTYVGLMILYDCSMGPYSSLSPAPNTQGLQSSNVDSTAKLQTKTRYLSKQDQDNNNNNKNNKDTAADVVHVPHRRDIPIDGPLWHHATPTHHACDGYNGIYHIESGDVGGASGTIFFQFVLAQIYYAKQYHFKPWIFFNNISHYIYDWNVHGIFPGVNMTMLDGLGAGYQHDPRYDRARYPGKPYPYLELPLPQRTFFFFGDGVWEHYFEPISDFVPGDRSCERKPRLTMDLWLITPGLHIFAPWTPRMWKYDVLPDYMQQRHVPLQQWLTPQRLMANELTQEYIFPKPFLWKMAERFVPRRRIRQRQPSSILPKPPNQDRQSYSSSSSSLLSKSFFKSSTAASGAATTQQNTSQYALGIHVRWSDKEGGRRKIAVDEFLPYVQHYVKEGGRHIFVATDSNLVLRHMLTKWPETIRSMIVSQGQEVVRSDTATPVFTLASHHRTNVEILVDILALSNCAFMLHGLSAVSDAAMYMEYDLIYQSVNLEDPMRMPPDEFGRMVHMVMTGQVTDAHYWHDIQPKEWWEEMKLPNNNTDSSSIQLAITANGSHDVCDGYDGILHIAVAGDKEFGVDMVFFQFILNQLLYADMYNLKPWIHLSNATHIYDERIHGKLRTISLMPNMTLDVYIPEVNMTLINQTLYYPGPPQVMLLENATNIDNLFGNTSIMNTTTASNTNNTSALSNEGEEYEYEDDKPPPQNLLSRMAGNGVWDTYMEPVSDFRPDDTTSCHNKKFVSLNKDQVMDGLALGWPYAIHAWRLDRMHDASLWKPPNMTIPQFFEPMRRKAHELIQKYYRFHPYLVKRAEVVNPPSKRPCLAMHIRRAGRSGPYRKRVGMKVFRDYARAYLKAGGKHIYLSVDSWRVWDDIVDKWSDDIRDSITTQGDYVVRTVRNVNLYVLDPDAHHRINSEILVDILAMSKCQFMLHGNSGMSEAAIYLNYDLSNRSINLEEENPMGIQEFEKMVQEYISIS